MTFALITAGHGSSFSTTSNGYTSGTLDTTGGDLLIVALSEGGGITNGAVTDSKSNTWVQLTIQTNNGKSSSLWYAWNATCGSSHTFTVSGTANFPSMCVAAFSGSQTSSDPFDVQNGANALFQGTLQTGSITPGSANELLVTSFMGDGDTSLATINSSFTVSDGVTDGSFGHQMSTLAYLIETTIAAQNPTWTRTGGNSTMAAAIASFKASGGAAVAAPVTPGRTLTGAGI